MWRSLLPDFSLSPAGQSAMNEVSYYLYHTQESYRFAWVGCKA
jgi:hypothetical protein